MASYIVALSVCAPGTEGDAMEHALKSLGNWAQLSAGCYAVTSNLPPGQVRDHLKKHAAPEDDIVVVHARRPYAVTGPPEIDAWLLANLEKR